MTKKRIADLLKEEIGKPAEKTDGDDPASQNQTSEAKPKATKSAAKTSAVKAKPAETKATATKTASKTTAAKASTSPAAESDALTRKVAELETALQKSADHVNALQVDVDTHQNRIFELKDALKSAEGMGKEKDAQIEKLTAELAEVKQTIVKLTEVSEAASEAEPEPTPEKKEPEAAKRQSLQLQQRSPYSGYKSIPEYAIQRGTPAGGQNNSMMNDDDLGWVD